MKKNTILFSADELLERFVTGVVESKPSVGLIECKLIPAIRGITHARVSSKLLNAKDSDVPWDNYQKGSPINLFLGNPMHEKGHWFAYSGSMANQDTNPWINNTLRAGDLVEGVVISYIVNDYNGEQAAVVLLTKNLTQDVKWQTESKKTYDGVTPRLLISNTPLDINQNLIENIHIGDKVHSSILSLDDSELKIELSVNAYLKQRNVNTIIHNDYVESRQSSSGEISIANNAKKHYSLLLIDDDEVLAKNYQASAKLYGDTVRYASTLKDVKKELGDKYTQFDAILLDFNLGDIQLEYEIRQVINEFLDHNDLLISLVSGEVEEALEDKPENWAFFNKALNHEQIHQWLKNKKAPAIPKYNKIQVAWDKNQGLAKKAFKRAEDLLDKCCQNTAAQGAAWIVMPRAKYYEFRVSYKLNTQLLDRIAPHLQYTLVGNCIETKEPNQHKKINSGKLADIFPINCDYVWAMPVEVSRAYDRVLLFFSVVPLSDKDREFLKEKKDHIADLGELLHMSTMLEESHTFAAEGLKLICQQHEISGELQSIIKQYDNLQYILNAPYTPDFKEKERKIITHVEELIQSIKRLDDRTSSNLDVINPENGMDTEKKYLLSDVLKQMQTRINLRKNSQEQVSLQYDKKFPDALKLNFPRRILEIALINVLDNAWHHGRGNPIIIRISISQKEASMPINIQIQDYGLGMTVEAKQKLKKPRYSRREKGHGMGVYLAMTLLEAYQAKLELKYTILWAGSCFEIQLPWRN